MLDEAGALGLRIDGEDSMLKGWRYPRKRNACPHGLGHATDRPEARSLGGGCSRGQVGLLRVEGDPNRPG